MDCDFLCMEDIYKLWMTRDDKYDVMCVKHDHKPQEQTKFLGAMQTRYEKKNWSSVILFNNAKCQALTPAYVNTASGLELHQFKWLQSDDEIGDIPERWNHLVDYNPAIENPANLHFTKGGPYFEEYRDCPYADLWRAELADMTSAG